MDSSTISDKNEQDVFLRFIEYSENTVTSVPLGQIKTHEFNAKKYGLYSFSLTDSSKKRIEEEYKIGIHDAKENEGEADLENNTVWIDSDISDFFFLDRSDSVRIIVKIGDKRYDSAFFSPEKASGERTDEMIRMLRVIEEYQPILLLSVFRKSPLDVYLGKNSNDHDSNDTRIRMIGDCIECYQKQFTEIKRVLKFKLNKREHPDRIEKLTGITPSTLAFMSQNPQYFVEIKDKKGIRYKDKNYLPTKTLIEENEIDYDIYENRYILSFLKMLIIECDTLKRRIGLAQKDAESWLKKASINSQERNFKTLVDAYRKQYKKVCTYRNEGEKLFSMYKIAFDMEDRSTSHKKNGKVKPISGRILRPKQTAIFRQIKEYNTIYTKAIRHWFDDGMIIPDVVDNKDCFKIAVSNPNTTYEIYIVTEFIKYMEESGYTLKEENARYSGISEKESRYQDYAYEFPFEKDGETITLFYSPSVHLLEKLDPEKADDKAICIIEKNGRELWCRFNEKNVDDHLFRNTKNSRVRGEDETNGKGAHYEPDFIVKYQKGDVVRYIMADAKHKDYEAVRQDEMPDLVYKYLDSIKVLNRKDSTLRPQILGLYAIYNEHSFDKEDTMTDETEYFEDNCLSTENEAFARFLYLNVKDKTGDNIIETIVNEIRTDL